MAISKNLAFRASAELSGLLVAMGSMIYISRVVGPEYVGFSATTSAILLLVTRLADGGLTSLASQRLARDGAQQRVVIHQQQVRQARRFHHVGRLSVPGVARPRPNWTSIAIRRMHAMNRITHRPERIGER